MPNVKSTKRKMTKEDAEIHERIKTRKIDFLKEELMTAGNQEHKLSIARELLDLTNDLMYSEIIHELCTNEIQPTENVTIQQIPNNIIEIESDEEFTGCCDNEIKTDKCVDLQLDKTVRYLSILNTLQ